VLAQASSQRRAAAARERHDATIYVGSRRVRPAQVFCTHNAQSGLRHTRFRYGNRKHKPGKGAPLPGYGAALQPTGVLIWHFYSRLALAWRAGSEMIKSARSD